MRPRSLKVDPHRAQLSDKFMNWCEQRRIEVVNSDRKANEEQDKVEHRAQLFELLLEDVLTDRYSQTKYECREYRDRLQEVNKSLLLVSDVSPIRVVLVRTIARTKLMLHSDKVNV